MIERDSPVGLTVHSLRSPALDEAARRTRSGRTKMLLVLAICAAPVIASYLSYYVIRPAGRTNYSELIEPMRPIPADLALVDLKGAPVKADSLKGQWLLVVVSGGACNSECEELLLLQRQLRETLGREKERVDKVWLLTDDAMPSQKTLDGVTINTSTTILRVPAQSLAAWLQPEAGHALEEHMFIVDPMGNWMMRAPPKPDRRKLKGDVDKLLTASAGWDNPGR